MSKNKSKTYVTTTHKTPSVCLFVFLLFLCLFVCADSTQLPFGRPAVMFHTDYSLLHHLEFISGYSKELKMSLWTAYTLPRQVHTHTLPRQVHTLPRQVHTHTLPRQVHTHTCPTAGCVQVPLLSSPPEPDPFALFDWLLGFHLLAV